MPENERDPPRVSDEMAKSVTTIMCTLIAGLVAWQAYSTYQTSIAVAELKRDFSFLERQVTDIKASLTGKK